MFQLNFRDSRPMYQQLEEQLRKHIVSGIIQTDEKLPSIREIATGLAINPNTISRAYKELEIQGYIYTIPGKGSFAAPINEVNDKREQQLLQQFDETVLELSYLGHDAKELINRMNNILEKENG